MSNRDGKTHSGLRDQSKLSYAGIASHPAIATNESPDVYDPRRAKGVTAARADTTDNGVLVSPRKKTSRPKKAKPVKKPPVPLASARRLQGRSVKGEERHQHRIKVADAYLTGVSTIADLAEEHQVSVHTVRDWVNDRRYTFEADHKCLPAVTSKREAQRDMAITVGAYGTGGNMSNEGVRRATRDLEKAIIKMQKKHNMPTFTYRKEATV